jgi:hypothetical protein
VVTSQVDERWRPVAGTQEEIACDTLLLSVGLIPENELSRLAGVALDPRTGGPVVDERLATNVPGIYAAGNVVHVYDLVDEVSASALTAGRSAAEHALGLAPPDDSAGLPVLAGENVHHVVPQRLHPGALTQGPVQLEFRVRQPVEAAVRVEVCADDQVLVSRRLRYARPSEMVVLPLAPELLGRLERAHALTVRVSQ